MHEKSNKNIKEVRINVKINIVRESTVNFRKDDRDHKASNIKVRPAQPSRDPTHFFPSCWPPKAIHCLHQDYHNIFLTSLPDSRFVPIISSPKGIFITCKSHPITPLLKPLGATHCPKLEIVQPHLYTNLSWSGPLISQASALAICCLKLCSL